MKVATTLAAAFLIMLPVVGFAQTVDAPVASISPATPITSGVPAQGTEKLAIPVSTPATGLAISLSPYNPTAGSFLYSTTAAASRASVLAIKFSAGSGSAITVSELKFHKKGTLSDSAIVGVSLLENDKIIYKYSSISNGVINFNGLSFTIAAGQTRTLWLTVDILSDLPVGNTVSFGLNTADDITVSDASYNSVAASGSFPIIGNIFTIIPVLSPAVSAPAIPAAPIQTQIPTPILVSKPTTPGVTVPPIAVSVSPIKCGVNSFGVNNECGVGMYAKVYVECYDGYEPAIGGASSCKSSEMWSQYAKESCVNHCSNNYLPKPLPAPTTPAIPATPSVSPATPVTPITLPPAPATPVTKCGFSTTKFCNECGAGVYKNVFVKCSDGSEITLGSASSCKPTDLWNQYANDACAIHCSSGGWGGWSDVTSGPIVCAEGNGEGVKILTPVSPTPISLPIATENLPVAVAINHCNEVAQWETKIAYYKKISSLNDDDLKKSGFSREEIDKITQELSLGIEKVRGQCGGRENTPIMPRITAITGSASIEETTKPVVVESGQEISAYYKAKLEQAVSTKGAEKQITELKTLRDEIDGLISNLIKSRKELEVSELNTLVKEVTVSRGEIKADDISVKTTEKKMLVNMGDRPVSVEPTTDQVLIRDKGLEVNTEAVMIKENVLSVGGVDVKMSASAVTEKLGLAPKTIELKEENAKAVYNMTIEERRKLFGFIPFNSQRTVTADAENGNTLSEHLPWYNFLTTK